MRNSETPTRVAIAIVAAIAVALSLGGCVQASREVIPTADPSVTPVFASNAAALAAAEKAYAAYLAVSDQIANDGGANPQRLASVVTPKWLPTELDSYVAFEKTGNRFTGASTYSYFEIQQFTTNHGGLADVTAYICADVSKTRLLDSGGQDITSPNRASLYPIVAEFQSTRPKSSDLLFAGSKPWSGKSFCS